MPVTQCTPNLCNRSHFWRFCIKVSGVVFCFGVFVLVASCSFIKNPLLGQWVHTTNGNKVLLELDKNEQCTLTLERLLQKARTVECEYRSADKNGETDVPTHYVYLKDTNGQCATEPDFNFIWHKKNKMIDFFAGGEPLEMRKP